VLWRLQNWGYVEFGFYGVSHAPACGFLTLILLYIACVPVIYLCPDRWLTGALLGQGVLFTFLAFTPLMAAALFAAALLCFVICTRLKRFWIKATCLSLTLFAPAAGLLLESDRLPLFGFAFAMIAGFKVFLAATETHTRKTGAGELPRFLVYLFLAPNLVIPPYHVVIPEYGV
ncbi:MAG: hypothetical protein GY953_49390, partial [bacterium]|nr:hypothetical protein [bacterium]